MTILSGGYQGARSCTSGPQPGVWGAMDYFLSAYAPKGGVNTGIYNCRTVRGGRTTSLHGEGRAADFGIRPHGAAYGTALANAIVAMSKELQVQCVIWNRKIWSSSYPHSGWRKYNGVASHVDHLHVEFTWAGANRGRAEAAKLWAKTLGGVKPGDIKVGTTGNTYTEVKGSTPLVKLYHKGEPVKRIQAAVGVKVDGYYGPDTANAVAAFQKKRGLAADKIVGPDTWAAINGGKSKPAPKPKVPGPGHAFPLPNGHYFGPKSGPDRSWSGFHNRKVKGKTDRQWLREFATQLGRRGWSVGSGKTWLKRAGNDGKYGSEYAALIKAFQKDQGLSPDSLLGKKTWDAAFQNPIT